jgi:hypothetical protein
LTEEFPIPVIIREAIIFRLQDEATFFSEGSGQEERTAYKEIASSESNKEEPYVGPVRDAAPLTRVSMDRRTEPRHEGERAALT